MGSIIESNDTLVITSEQGFPSDLGIKEHLKSPYKAEQFKNRIFNFKNKEGIRVYHQPPVRVFLVQKIEDKWLYWGLIHIQAIKHDYVKKMTSGTYKVVKIYSIEEMKKANAMIDGNNDKKYLP